MKGEIMFPCKTLIRFQTGLFEKPIIACPLHDKDCPNKKHEEVKKKDFEVFQW